jgi:hypothetical protein
MSDTIKTPTPPAKAASATFRATRASHSSPSVLTTGGARHCPSHVGTMIWASRAALGAGGRNGTDR